MDFFISLTPKDEITLLGIALTFLISLISFIQVLKRMKLDNITQKRVEWINLLREYMADFLSNADIYKVYVYSKCDDKLLDYRDNLINKSSIIKLHLNFKGNIDKRIIKLLDELVNNLFLLLLLKRLDYLLIKEALALRPGYFKSFIMQNPDPVLLNFLKRYSISYNKNTTLKNDEEKSGEDLIGKIASDYISIYNSTSFFDVFLNNMKDIYQELFKDLTESRIELIKLTQIYLKAEWTRVKRELRPWPFSIYIEERMIKRFEKKWDDYNKSTTTLK